MSRDITLYLDDILSAIEFIREFTREMTIDEFRTDIRTQHACVRNLEIIGEAAKHIPNDVKSATSEVEWRKITGLRDILSHQYFGIDVEIIWDVIASKLGELESHVIELKRRLPPKQ